MCFTVEKNAEINSNDSENMERYHTHKKQKYPGVLADGNGDQPNLQDMCLF